MWSSKLEVAQMSLSDEMYPVLAGTEQVELEFPALFPLCYDDLIAYMESHGWRHQVIDDERYILYVLDSQPLMDGTPMTYVFPRNMRMPVIRFSMRGMVGNLAILEGVNPIQIIAQINALGATKKAPKL